MDKLRYGVIGTGNIAVCKHLPGYAALTGDVEIVAACDIDRDRLDRVADQYHIPQRFTDWRELLAVKELDFVSVCVPNYLHAPVTVAALQAGKHVHCEKPMAVNGPLAQQMLEESRRCGRVLMVGLNNRFTPWNRYALDCVKSGALGTVYHAKCGWIRRAGLPHTAWFADKALAGGGALIDLGVHYIDLVLHFLGYPAPHGVVARTYNHLGAGKDATMYMHRPIEYPFDVEDLAAGFIDLDGGASLSFEISWASNISQECAFYELYGTKGGIRFAMMPDGPELKLYTVSNGRHVDCTPLLPKEGDGSEFAEFISCIREGKAPWTAPPEQAVAMMTLVDAIYRSAAEGRQILL